VLTMEGDDSRWDPLPDMRMPRQGFACDAIGGCVFVAGGTANLPIETAATVEVYEEALGRWRRLPCSLPHVVESPSFQALLHMAVYPGRAALSCDGGYTTTARRDTEIVQQGQKRKATKSDATTEENVTRIRTQMYNTRRRPRELRSRCNTKKTTKSQNAHSRSWLKR
jgi:hypothetical protein